MTVTSILSVKGKDIISIEPTATLKVAANLLATRKIGALLVLGADDRLVGIISERDLVRALSERGANAFEEPVSQVMTRSVATCTEDEAITSVMERMTSGKFRHMPVMKGSKIVGIVSIGDVVKDRLAMMEQETEAIRDYIRSA